MIWERAIKTGGRNAVDLMWNSTHLWPVNPIMAVNGLPAETNITIYFMIEWARWKSGGVGLPDMGNFD